MSTPTLLDAIRDKAQQRIARQLFTHADESNDQLKALREAIAECCGAQDSVGPIKARERAESKVLTDYGGDWYDLKDTVRLTIIAPDLPRLAAVQREVRARCVAREGLGLIKDSEVRPETSACGYSGLNFVVRLKNGWPAEIQANIPQVMYGQMSRQTFCAIIGHETYGRIKSRYWIEGGLGHIFYEIYRVSPGSANGKRSAALSRAYFSYLRGAPSPGVAQKLEDEINVYRKANPYAFAH